jgi:16S rRNA (cytosine967-C5)-methyltransferase
MKRERKLRCDQARLAAFSVLTSFDRLPSPLPDLLESEINLKDLSSLDRAFVSHLVYGVTRFREQLDFVIDRHVSKGKFEKHRRKAALLRLGSFQMMPGSKVPAPAAINETVKLTRAVLGDGLTGFINAVLRAIAAESDRWAELIPSGNAIEELSVRYSQPDWLVNLLVRDHGIDIALRFLSAFLKRLDTAVRVNTLRSSRPRFEQSLKGLGIPVAKSPHQDDYYVLPYSVNPLQFAPLAEGTCFVQNAASGVIAEFLSPDSSDRILDMCAAPGGKTAALAMITGRPENIVALDVDGRRMEAARKTFARLGLDGVKAHVADGRSHANSGFDKVLIDAPCSGFGTLAKHPEIKYTQSAENVVKLATIQLELLKNAANLLNHNGVLVYSVCTMSRLETVEIRNEFLRSNQNFALDVADDFRYHQFVRDDNTLLIPPGQDNMEGMFAFRARKVR